MKNRTLTTIGLPLRLEVLIKSHLKLVNARTIDRWSFSDENATDVAICDPDSPLSAVTVRRSRESGSPLCISLVDSRRQPLHGTIALHDPLRVNDVIELLDRVSNGLKPAPMGEESPVARVDDVTDFQHGHRTRIAHMLHDLMKAGSRDLHLIEAGPMRFCLLPVSRSLFLQEPLSDSWMDAVLDVECDVSASIIPTAHQQQALATFQHRAPAIKLLWSAGLNGAQATHVPALLGTTAFSLTRWPDFGNLKHKPVHLRMAAELSRKRMTMSQLANLTRTSIEQVGAFVNACALCDLVITGPHPQTPPAGVAEAAASTSSFDAPRRGLGFLHSIRLALGLRVA